MQLAQNIIYSKFLSVEKGNPLNYIFVWFAFPKSMLFSAWINGTVFPNNDFLNVNCNQKKQLPYLAFN